MLQVSSNKIDSAIFQERTEEALKDLTGIITFQDDVLVFRNNDSQSRQEAITGCEGSIESQSILDQWKKPGKILKQFFSGIHYFSKKNTARWSKCQ